MNIHYGSIRVFYSLKNIFTKYFALLDPFALPSLPWLIRMRLKHFTSLLTIALAIGLVLSVSSIASALILPQETPNYLLKILIILLLTLMLVGLDLFRRSPPSRYAEISVEGIGIKNAFRVTAYEIWKILIKFKIENQQLNQISQSLSAKPQLSKKQRKQIAVHILQLESLENRQQRILQNIIEIKKIVSVNFQIPQRRLCDYIFQFSPSIYSELLSKYISNWKEIARIYDYGNAISLDNDQIGKRYSDLARSTDRIFSNIVSSIKYQIQLLKYHKFHAYIHSIAHDWSTSSALRNYIEAISEIAREEKVDYEKLRYMFFKRNSHPGFDLHRSCENFCDKYRSELGTHYHLIKEFLQVLRISKECLDVQKYQMPLQALFIKFHSQLVKSRDEIIGKFTNQYDSIVEHQKFEDTLIIIQGYSKTVRQIVKKGVSDVLKKSKAGKANGPRIFLLKADNEDTDMLTTRIMRYELTSDKEYQHIKAIFFAGDKKHLLSILRRGMQAVLFLGAECFDTNESGRVVRAMHTKGISQSIVKLKEDVDIKTETKCKVVLFAEKYKQYQNLLNEQDFYKDHLEGIDIYTEGMIDYLISDT